MVRVAVTQVAGALNRESPPPRSTTVPRFFKQLEINVRTRKHYKITDNLHLLLVYP